MNPLNLITDPIFNLARAIWLPLKAVLVVGLCALINTMTSPGDWWFQWVAFGMGIAVLLSWARAIKTLVLLGLLYFAGQWLLRRYGESVHRRFDEWAAHVQPRASQMVHAVREALKPAP